MSIKTQKEVKDNFDTKIFTKEGTHSHLISLGKKKK